ncbi:MAG: flagellar assembly protein FliX [Pseudomonadota bacterium]
MKIGPKHTGSTKATSKTGRAGKAAGSGAAEGSAAFRIADAASTASASTSSASMAGASEALQALIDLQSAAAAPSGGAGRRKLLTAGRQALTLLDRIQQGLLSGRVYRADLEALREQTAQNADLLAGAGADPALAGLYEDIALRARIELAKLER